MIELDVEREGSDGKEQEGDVRVHEGIENGFLQGHAERHKRLARQTERSGLSVEALEILSLHLAEKLFRSRCDIVDEVPSERFLFREGFGLAHGTLGSFNAASALGGDGTHESSRVILDFPAHLVV